MDRATVLIAFDGSEEAAGAVRAAAALFPAAAAVVVHVRTLPLTDEGAALARAALPDDVIHTAVARYEALAAQDAAAIAERGTALARDAGLAAEPAVHAAAAPWRGLLAAAAEHAADVLVCGTRGQGATARAVTGSTSSSLHYHAPLPVLAVPVGADPGDGPALIGYDGSDGAQAAIAAVARLLPGRAAVVAHAWTSPVRRTFAGESLLDAPLDEIQAVARDLDALFEGDAEELAEAGAALAREHGLEARSVAPQAGGADWHGLVAAAASERAALIAVGSRGRGALAATVLGSVSAGLVHNADLPVLVIPGA